MYRFEHEADIKLLVFVKGSTKGRSLYLTKDEWQEVASLIRKQGEKAIEKEAKSDEC